MSTASTAPRTPRRRGSAERGLAISIAASRGICAAAREVVPAEGGLSLEREEEGEGEEEGPDAEAGREERGGGVAVAAFAVFEGLYSFLSINNNQLTVSGRSRFETTFVSTSS